MSGVEAKLGQSLDDLIKSQKAVAKKTTGASKVRTLSSLPSPSAHSLSDDDHVPEEKDPLQGRQARPEVQAQGRQDGRCINPQGPEGRRHQDEREEDSGVHQGGCQKGQGHGHGHRR